MAHPQPARPSQQLLQWLDRVIAPEYTEPPRTYHDVATTLATMPSLSPRTAVYTYENGHSELLLQLSGTLPAVYRNQPFNVPITIWIPHQYPRKPPMSFISPPPELLIRPGNYVDPSGKCYHPYLANWVNHAERSSIRDLCDILCDVFSREPPVIAKTQQQAPPQPLRDEAPPPRPPLPPELDNQERKVNRVKQPSTPPPLPPLPKEYTGSQNPTPPPSTSLPIQPRPPPLPPHPQNRLESKTAIGLNFTLPIRSGAPQLSSHPQHRAESNTITGRTGTLPLQPPPKHNHPELIPPPLPPAPHRNQQSQHIQHTSTQPQRPVYMSSSFSQQPIQASPLGPNRYNSPAPPPNQRPVSFAGFPPQNHQYPHTQPPTPQKAPPKPKTAPLPDLLDDHAPPPPSPPPVSTSAPPPPPNPEKDRLINTIVVALEQKALSTVNQTNDALASATSQHQAMLAAEYRMRQELTGLSELSELCDRDTEILKERIAATERVIEDARKRELPPGDELVVPACVLHRQLYDLVAEDRAIEDTIYVLGKALDREKVSLDVFVKHVRGLAREQFLKRALAKKIGDQLGLVGY